MRLISLLIIFAASLLVGSAVAKDESQPLPAPASTAASKSAKAEVDESQVKEHSSYVNRSGQRVHSPARSTTDAIPHGAGAKCRDGTYSFSQHRGGTCSHHGGVAAWL